MADSLTKLFSAIVCEQQNQQGRGPIDLVCARKESCPCALGFRTIAALSNFALKKNKSPSFILAEPRPGGYSFSGIAQITALIILLVLIIASIILFFEFP